MKKILSSLVAFALLLIVIPFSASAQEITTPSINTPEDYINYLKENNSAISLQSDEDSNHVLKQFTALSKEDQEKFIKYISDPQVAKAIFEAMQSGKNNVELYNGDIKVSTGNESPKSGISLSAATYKVEHEAVSTVLGVDIIKTKVYVQYTVGGTKVTGIVNGGGIVLRNWFPSISISVKEDKAYVNTDKSRAYQTAYFTWNFVHDKLGLTFGTATHTVWGYTNGTKGSSFSKS